MWRFLITLGDGSPFRWQMSLPDKDGRHQRITIQRRNWTGNVRPNNYQELTPNEINNRSHDNGAPVNFERQDLKQMFHHFRDMEFNLDNNVQTMNIPITPPSLGLGRFIYHNLQYPDTTVAQTASQLVSIFTNAGIILMIQNNPEMLFRVAYEGNKTARLQEYYLNGH